MLNFLYKKKRQTSSHILKHPFQRSDRSNPANPTSLEQAIFKRSSQTMEIRAHNYKRNSLGYVLFVERKGLKVSFEGHWRCLPENPTA